MQLQVLNSDRRPPRRAVPRKDTQRGAALKGQGNRSHFTCLGTTALTSIATSQVSSNPNLDPHHKMPVCFLKLRKEVTDQAIPRLTLTSTSKPCQQKQAYKPLNHSLPGRGSTLKPEKGLCSPTLKKCRYIKQSSLPVPSHSIRVPVEQLPHDDEGQSTGLVPKVSQAERGRQDKTKQNKIPKNVSTTKREERKFSQNQNQAVSAQN